jgi:hypothetical protein
MARPATPPLPAAPIAMKISAKVLYFFIENQTVSVIFSVQECCFVGVVNISKLRLDIIRSFDMFLHLRDFPGCGHGSAGSTPVVTPRTTKLPSPVTMLPNRSCPTEALTPPM